MRECLRTHRAIQKWASTKHILGVALQALEVFSIARKSEIMNGSNEKRQLLYQWNEANVLLKMVEVAAEQITQEKFLSERQYKIYREAWVAAKIGLLIGSCELKMVGNDPPDAYLKRGPGREIPLEITELLQSGRRRGNEKKEGTVEIPGAQLAAAEEQNSIWLENRIHAKFSKDLKYPNGTVLVVYHNTDLFPFDPQRVSSELEAAATLASTNIMGSVIFYNGRIYGKRAIGLLRG